MSAQLKMFQIFRAGTHTCMGGASMHFSEQDLQAIAAAYNPITKAAPLVLGHPENDLPAYGKVQALFVKKDGLFAQAQVIDELVALVKAGRYRPVSASFIPPFSNSNPTPGAYYLKHVGFLGAMPPAVKGMNPPEFSERPDSLYFNECYSVVDTQSVAFGERGGYSLEPDRVAMHRLATEYQHVCPALSYSEAVTLADRALSFEF
ncbi:hypothetical protein B0T45_13920 [Chromobacterium haemolyticum]|uniref:Peptidase n=2 Tax=Chromobacterium haemolyticum TaxID=394935 RepID=A0A1W0CSA1_9NEIS|nr:hypothetical protein B0T45_13920 [Chromobacterium haemolyticum]